jgi:hypothetical protein
VWATVQAVINVPRSLARPGLCAALLFTLAALPRLASAKPCGRLCKPDVQTCRSECTGTRREVRRCRGICKPALRAVCRSFPADSCLPPLGACGFEPITCPIIGLTFSGFTPRDRGGLPSDYPLAPEASSLCGSVQGSTDSGTAVVVFFTTAATADEVAAYYGTAFRAAGYAFDEDASVLAADRVSCDRAFRITRNGAPNGGLYLFAQQGAYAVIWGSTTPRSVTP